MIVDASALIAILLSEREGRDLATTLKSAASG
jgi:uncharacterized protein with PIN domain